MVYLPKVVGTICILDGKFTILREVLYRYIHTWLESNVYMDTRKCMQYIKRNKLSSNFIFMFMLVTLIF